MHYQLAGFSQAHFVTKNTPMSLQNTVLLHFFAEYGNTLHVGIALDFGPANTNVIA